MYVKQCFLVALSLSWVPVTMCSGRAVNRNSIRGVLSTVFVCPEFGCGRVINSLGNIRSHLQNTHSYAYPSILEVCYCCDLCERAFSECDKKGMQQHILEEHREEVRENIRTGSYIDWINVLVQRPGLPGIKLVRLSGPKAHCARPKRKMDAIEKELPHEETRSCRRALRLSLAASDDSGIVEDAAAILFSLSRGNAVFS